MASALTQQQDTDPLLYWSVAAAGLEEAVGGCGADRTVGAGEPETWVWPCVCLLFCSLRQHLDFLGFPFLLCVTRELDY